MWIRNSPLAADHAAAGAFESAMQVSQAFYISSSFHPPRCAPTYLCLYTTPFTLRPNVANTFLAPQPPSRRRQLYPPQTPLPTMLSIRPRLCPRQPLSPTSCIQCPPEPRDYRDERGSSRCCVRAVSYQRGGIGRGE
jgi:hypothetical protein